MWTGCQPQEGSRPDPYDLAIQEYRHQRSSPSLTAATTASDRTIPVRIHLLRVSDEETSSVSTLWRLAEEERITPSKPELFSESGFRVGHAGRPLRSQLRMLESRLSSAESSDVELSLRDGSSGFAEIGSRVAIPLFYYKSDLFSRMDYAFDRVVQRLRIAVHSTTDGRIELDVTPILFNLRNDGGNFFLSDLNIKTILDPGHALFFGWSNTGRQDIASAFLTCDVKGQKGKTLIVIAPLSPRDSPGGIE